jgi:hypothetical protein
MDMEPAVDGLEAAILIAGVVPPDDEIGEVPVTEVTALVKYATFDPEVTWPLAFVVTLL